MRRMIAGAALAGVMVTAASAQELRPILQMIGEGAEDDYVALRCGAAFLALAEWSGAERLGEDRFAKIGTRVEMLLDAAVVARLDSGMGGGAAHVAEITARDVRNVANLYLERFEANYAREGQAFGADALFQSDLQICSLLGSGKL